LNGNNYRSNPNISDCTFTENSSEYGGGICNSYYCSPVIENGTFTVNVADSGGGIHNFCDSNATIIECSFFDNEAVESGGGICNGSSAPVITDCLFTGNKSFGDSLEGGGGICNNGSASPQIASCVFFGNSSSKYGGAVYNQSVGSPNITNCTLVHNEANHGGSIYNRESSPKITNCISWWNTGRLSHDEIYDFASSPAITYSDISGGYLGEGNISADPLIVNPYGFNFRLLPASPCIDSGSNAAAESAGLTEDFYGKQRTCNGIVDIGADEATEWNCLLYDDNQNNRIGYNEMVNALMDYLADQITYSQMVDVLMCYLTS